MTAQVKMVHFVIDGEFTTNMAPQSLERRRRT